MMSGVSRPVPPEWAASPVVVSLPDAGDDLAPACEVLVQEGLRTWSVPVERAAEVAGLRAAFGRRARIGVHGLTDVGQAEAARAADPAFVATSLLLADLPGAVDGVPVILGGLTPDELWRGYRAGAAAVQVIPAEAFGSGYARVLPGMLPGVPVLATGRMERYQADLWWEAGAVAVWPDPLVTVDLVVGADLDELRRRCQHWRSGD